MVENEDQIPQEKSQPIKDQGLVTDAYSEVPAVVANQEQKERLADETGIRVQYGFYADEIKTALKIFQRELLYKKYTIYSLLLGIIFVIYLVSTINSSGSKFNLFMTVLSLTVLLFIWYFPLNHIRQVVKTISKMEYKEEYILTVYDSAIEIGENENSAIYFYEDAPIRIWETEELFIIGYEKVRVFVVPKRCCNENAEEISKRFETGAKDKYKRITVKKSK